jgi:TolA-binding protein
MLKLGMSYEMKGEAEKARQTYEKLGREFPDSEASSSALQYLRLLDLKTQKG